MVASVQKRCNSDTRRSSGPANRSWRAKHVSPAWTRQPREAKNCAARSTVAASGMYDEGATNPTVRLRCGKVVAPVADLRVVWQRPALLQFAPLRKELREQGGAFFAQHTGRDGGVMVQPRLCEEIDHASARAGLRIARSEDQPADARVLDRAGAHRARFERDVEIAMREPVVAQHLCGGAHRLDLGVSRGISIADGLVESGRDHLSILD